MVETFTVDITKQGKFRISEEGWMGVYHGNIELEKIMKLTETLVKPKGRTKDQE